MAHNVQVVFNMVVRLLLVLSDPRLPQLTPGIRDRLGHASVSVYFRRFLRVFLQGFGPPALAFFEGLDDTIPAEGLPDIPKDLFDWAAGTRQTQHYLDWVVPYVVAFARRTANFDRFKLEFLKLDRNTQRLVNAFLPETARITLKQDRALKKDQKNRDLPVPALPSIPPAERDWVQSRLGDQDGARVPAEAFDPFRDQATETGTHYVGHLFDARLAKNHKNNEVKATDDKGRAVKGHFPHLHGFHNRLLGFLNGALNRYRSENWPEMNFGDNANARFNRLSRLTFAEQDTQIGQWPDADLGMRALYSAWLLDQYMRRLRHDAAFRNFHLRRGGLRGYSSVTLPAFPLNWAALEQAAGVNQPSLGVGPPSVTQAHAGGQGLAGGQGPAGGQAHAGGQGLAGGQGPAGGQAQGAEESEEESE